MTKASKGGGAPRNKKTDLVATAAALDQAPPRGMRRDRKTQRTRRELAEAAVRLFAAKGFAAATIDEIADTADYSTSTFFRQFADKEEVIFYDFGERLEELTAAFAAPHQGSAWEVIHAAFIEFARRWDDDGEIARLRARLFHIEPTLKYRYLAKNGEWEEAIATLIAAEMGKVPDAELTARLIAGAAVAAFRSAWHTQLHGKNLALADCVEKAFGKLEGIGLFFRLPEATKKPQPKTGRQRKKP